jgi:hypothetical protein
MPAPREVPSERIKASGRLKAEFVARTHGGRKVWARVADQGDPSNRVTIKCICEASLAVALDGDHLPGGAFRGGVLTPATALGEVLISTLWQAGMTIEFVARFPEREHSHFSRASIVAISADLSDDFVNAICQSRTGSSEQDRTPQARPHGSGQLVRRWWGSLLTGGAPV